MWFPGDVAVVGMTAEEQLGAEGAQLLRVVRAASSPQELAQARTAIEAFVRSRPGDSTAVSAGLTLVAKDRTPFLQRGRSR